MAPVHEFETLRNQTHIFSDRFEAGKQLSRMLAAELDDKDVIVLTATTRGISVGRMIRRRFNCSLGLILAGTDTEADASAWDKWDFESVLSSDARIAYLDPLAAASRFQEDGSDTPTILTRGILWKIEPFPDLTGKTVILTSDGLIRGQNIHAALGLVKKYFAAKVVLAVPTAPGQTLEILRNDVDAIYCANIRDLFFSYAVADAYIYRSPQAPEPARPTLEV